MLTRLKQPPLLNITNLLCALTAERLVVCQSLKKTIGTVWLVLFAPTPAGGQGGGMVFDLYIFIGGLKLEAVVEAESLEEAKQKILKTVEIKKQ